MTGAEGSEHRCGVGNENAPLRDRDITSLSPRLHVAAPRPPSSHAAQRSAAQRRGPMQD